MGRIKGWTKDVDRRGFMRWKRTKKSPDGIQDVVTVERHPRGEWKWTASLERGEYGDSYSRKESALNEAIDFMRSSP